MRWLSKVNWPGHCIFSLKSCFADFAWSACDKNLVRWKRTNNTTVGKGLASHQQRKVFQETKDEPWNVRKMRSENIRKDLEINFILEITGWRRPLGHRKRKKKVEKRGESFRKKIGYMKTGLVWKFFIHNRSFILWRV